MRAGPAGKKSPGRAPRPGRDPPCRGSSSDRRPAARVVSTLAREARIDEPEKSAPSANTGATQTLRAVFLGPRDPGFAGSLDTGEVSMPGTGRELPSKYRVIDGLIRIHLPGASILNRRTCPGANNSAREVLGRKHGSDRDSRRYRPVRIYVAEGVAALGAGLSHGATETPSSPKPRALPTTAKPWTGDFDQMVERRIIWVLVPFSARCTLATGGSSAASRPSTCATSSVTSTRST